MRTFFLLLLLANVAFFGWSRFLAPQEPAMARKDEPERLPIVSPPPVPAPSAAAAPPPAGAPVPATQASVLEDCLEWGRFTLAQRALADRMLEPFALGERVSERRTAQGGWWVYIPPLPNRQAANERAAQLKDLGVQGYSVIAEEGALRWAVSLGVFRTVESAQARLASLRGLGVSGVVVAPRDTVVPTIWLQIRALDPSEEAKLRELAREIEGSVLRPCPA